MKHTDHTGILPAQFTGDEIEAEASVDLIDESEAKLFYAVVKERLLEVNNWHKVAGIISAGFQLVNDAGEEVTGQARKGDYLKIDIPGPGSKEGDGFDWVVIEELKELDTDHNQSIGFRVRPAKNPLGTKDETAHFYSAEATSNFMVSRETGRVIAWIVDRNLKPNDHAASLMDKIRDTSIGLGAIGIFSKIQWKGLAEGLIKKAK